LGTFEAQRPLIVLSERPWEFFGGEVVIFLLALVVSLTSAVIVNLLTGKRESGYTSSLTLQSFIVTLTISSIIMFLIAIGINRFALGT
jgi:hypothetical protein